MTSHEIVEGALGERGRVSRRFVIGAIVIVAIVAAVVAWLAFNGGSSSTASASAGDTTLAVVTRRDLAETQTESGTLGYAGPRTLSVPSSSGQSSGGGQGAAASASTGSSSGTVTWLAPEGSVVRRGGVLYRVDNAPVVLMYGTVPVYRTLSAGIADGPDVRQLEWNLVALGYDPGVVDDALRLRDGRGGEALAGRARRQTQTGVVALGVDGVPAGPAADRPADRDRRLRRPARLPGDDHHLDARRT